MKKILLVDDDIFLLKVYRSLLEKDGFVVYTLENGTQVKDIAKKEHPDCIILDCIMPKKNGFEALEDLKDSEDTKNIPVFIVTVLQDEDTKHKVKSFGGVEFFVKSQTSFDNIKKYLKKKFSVE